MTLMGKSVDGLVTMEEVQNNENHEVEYATSRHIAHGNIRDLGHCDRTDPRDQFRQRGDG